MRYALRTFFSLLLAAIALVGTPAPDVRAAGPASLLFTPSSGEYFVGSTFDVAIVLNTNGQAVNAVQADIRFPADKIQVVNPSASTSFITLWVSQPSFSNIDGTITFQGGIPSPGITTSNGIVSTVTFRVVAPGPVALSFADTSQVLLNDGQGTDVLQTRGIAQFTARVPPPEGPVTISTSHQDPTTWYMNRSATFSWTPLEGAEGYSYAFDQRPLTIPDETIDTLDTVASGTADADGDWYFHIRGKTVAWGGTTHVSVRIDGTPPAAFTPVVETGPPSEQSKPIVTFVTTDAASGIDHYEVRVTALEGASEGTPFFTEQSSPYQLPPLGPGRYEVIVRAYDRAGNTTDGKASFTLEESGALLLEEPLVQNTLLMNIALIVFGMIAASLVGYFIWRRTHRARVVLSELTQLEHETQEKEQELSRELQKQREVEKQIEHELHEPDDDSSGPQPIDPNSFGNQR